MVGSSSSLVKDAGVQTMAMAKHNVHQIEGIPILEGGGALVK